jgi:hypothetical protein
LSRLKLPRRPSISMPFWLRRSAFPFLPDLRGKSAGTPHLLLWCSGRTVVAVERTSAPAFRFSPHAAHRGLSTSLPPPEELPTLKVLARATATCTRLVDAIVRAHQERP